ncbi:UNVERIFIED_CONTAM: Cyclin-dependent kinase G-2 [Sesamum latifolium]|uniref:Cyclin-dependent kinase G-2 n=1 Tax=Sesamum latifolium TaxID=2727402 RepID=A0AAW2X0E3_9LAMI
MAAGRHGVYRDNEFRDRETDFGMTKKENGRAKRDDGRVRNGVREYERGQGRDSLEYKGRVRQKDIKEREVINGGYHATSSHSDSGSSGGGPKRCELAARAIDREPGELSSDGSDEAVDSETQVNEDAEVKKMENVNHLSPLQNKKRKFSPIVWDRDNRNISRAIKSRSASDTVTLPPSPPLIKSYRQSPIPKPSPDGKVQTSPTVSNEVKLEASPPKVNLRPDLSEFPAETSSLHPEEEQWVKNTEPGTIDDDDYVPTRTIISSRWANDAESPADEGEISDYEDIPKLHRKPGLGDSYHDSDDRNEYMEMDDDRNYDGASVSKSETESEDDHGSHGTPEPAQPPQRSVNMLQGCRSVDEFERLNKIDEGTYGVVYRARDKKTGEIVALKKICDFGLARQYGSPLKPYTHLVVTLWYRAPELLLGAKQYSTAIDMWSLGCIMAELLSKEPLFNGKTEFDQLDKIFRILGTPNETIWPGFSKLPGVKVNFVKHQLPALGDLVWLSGLHWKFPATSFTGSPVLSDAGFDLLNKLLTYDPEKRITAEAALNHEWFREVPLPKSKEFMPTFPAHHAQDRRIRRVMKSPDPLEEQRRKELQQGEIGTGGLFGQ